MAKKKDPAAVSLGRRGGLKGGKVRAARLSPEQRRESARRAVQARWARRRAPGPYDSVANRNSPLEVRETSQQSEVPYTVHLIDCFDWLRAREPNSIEAVVTDPPYGLVEFTETEKAKLRAGKGGVWRIPPSFDGIARSPVPRFTVLSVSDHRELFEFFSRWGQLIYPVLVPGAHVFVASNPLLSDLVSAALRRSNLEKRGEVIRLVQTLRGGDRPKNAHDEFKSVTVMARSCYEPWLVFRKPCEGRVQDNLRTYGTGGLKRSSAQQPFRDVIASSPTRREERNLASHPSLKPQSFMRQIVSAALPLGRGIILDPFMGAGSTIAAATAVGYRSIGLESDATFFSIAKNGIPRLARLGGVAARRDDNLALDFAQTR